MSEAELRVQCCERCNHRMFPERLACSRCGSSRLASEPAGPGAVVDHVEILRAPSGVGEGPVRIVLVQLDSGPRLLARAPLPLAAGDRVALSDDGHAVGARAVAGAISPFL